jgi:hypothetical protein
MAELERADIDAIKILASCWELAGKDSYQYQVHRKNDPNTTNTNRGLIYSALKGRQKLDHAIRWLRSGITYHNKNRVYRTNRTGEPGRNLWNL